MKKSIILSALLFFTFMVSGSGQSYMRGPQGRIASVQNVNNAGNRQCKRLKKGHMRSMRKMALADGKVTPREKRLLRRERRRVF